METCISSKVAESRDAGRILICEDERIVAKDLARTLTKAGHEVVGIAESRNKALGLARTHLPDLALMDIRIRGDADGVQVAQELSEYCGIPSIFLTAHGDKDTFRRAKSANPLGYILKPFKAREVEIAVELGLEQRFSSSFSADSNRMPPEQQRMLLQRINMRTGGGSSRISKIDLNHYLREAIPLSRPASQMAARCNFQFADGTTTVLIDPNKIRECLVQILFHLSQTQESEFQLNVKTSLRLEEHPEKWNSDAFPGWYIGTEIEAVPCETYSSILPMTVTKSDRLPTDMPIGLWVAKSILSEHLGWIRYGQQDGRICRIALYLPRAH